MGFHALSCLKKLFSEAHCGYGPVFMIPHCAGGLFWNSGWIERWPWTSLTILTWCVYGFSCSKLSKKIIFWRWLWLRSRFYDSTLCRRDVLKFWWLKKLILAFLKFLERCVWCLKGFFEVCVGVCININFYYFVFLNFLEKFVIEILANI